MSISARAAGRIVQTVDESERRLRGGPADPAGVPVYQRTQRIALTGALGVPARSGNVPGSTSVDLQRWSADGSTLEADTDPDGNQLAVTVRNICASAVAANKYIKIALVDGQWVVDVEDCN